MRLSKYTIALAVTAAVTFDVGAGLGARAQSSLTSVPTITNLDTGHQYPYQKTFPSQQTCDAALGNLPEILAAVRNPDPAVTAPDYKGGNQELADNVVALVIQIYMNTGKLPNFSISCESTGDPA